MDSLETYAQIFDESYPAYADSRYEGIKKLVKAYDAEGISDLISGEAFKNLLALITPVIAIKNYKSRIPFPEDMVAVIKCVASVRATKPQGSNILEAHMVQFENILSLEGFQLPTASAIFHFCHPNDFPIVDVNVEAACAFLKQRYPNDFDGIDAPSLPLATTPLDNKAKKYVEFISFIAKVKVLQSVYGGQPDYRYVDKALMVLGVLRLRNKVDATDAN